MIDSAAELYVHAIAIEREAAERYAELAGRMADLDNHEAAALFRFLSRAEARHLAALRRRTEGVALPALCADYSWLDDGPPLKIALLAEKRARAFFEQVMRTADDPALRALAREMAAEEGEHIALLQAFS